MAEARQQAEWLRVGVLVSWIVNRNGWTRSAITPLAVIPEPFRPREREKSEEEKAEENRLAWYVLDTYFGRKG